MRYFRYRNTDKTFSNAFRVQYANLTANEKRISRKEKIWKRISMTVTFLIFSSCMAAGICLLKLFPQPGSMILTFLLGIAKLVSGSILLIASAVLAYGLTTFLWKKAHSFHIPSMKKAVLSEACAHLREFYGLQEPYIITKCYDATDKRFQNHDLCIFVSHGELRLTTDLIHGFLHGERDLGCYAFVRDELSVFTERHGNRLITELKTEDKVFRLGHRAKLYIEHHFLKSDRIRGESMFPTELDGAEVLYYTRYDNYGTINYPNGDIADVYRYLAICRYSKDDCYYLFCCNENFEVVSDWPASSIDDCMKIATASYISRIAWIKME